MAGVGRIRIEAQASDADLTYYSPATGNLSGKHRDFSNDSLRVEFKFDFLSSLALISAT